MSLLLLRNKNRKSVQIFEDNLEQREKEEKGNKKTKKEKEWSFSCLIFQEKENKRENNKLRAQEEGEK